MSVEQNEIKTILTVDLGQAKSAVTEFKRELRSVEAQASKLKANANQEAIRFASELRSKLGTVSRDSTSIPKYSARDYDLSPQIKRSREEMVKLNEAAYALGSIIGTGLVAAFGLATTAMGYSIQRAAEYEKQMQELQGQATDSGVAFDIVKEKNNLVAESFGVSKIRAADLTNSLTELLSTANKFQDFDKVQQSVADIAAVRGMSLQQAASVLKAINDGSTLAARRFGVSDINKQLREYARSIGVTTTELTNQERAQVALNAITEKGKNVTGEAANAQNTLSGATQKAWADIDDMSLSFGRAITQSGIFQDGLRTLSDLAKGLTLDLDEVNKKMAEGITPDQAVRSTTSGPGFSTYLRSFLAGGFVSATGIFGETLRYASDPNLIHERDIQDLVAKATAEKAKSDAQKAEADRVAAEKAAADREEIRVRTEKKELEAWLKKSQRELQIETTTVSRMRAIREEGLKKIGDDPENKEKAERFAQQMDDAIKKTIETGKSRVKELRREWEGVFQSLARQQAADNNPLSLIIIDAKKNWEDLLQSIKGLPKALQEAAKASQRELNANQLFGALLDNALDVDSLRQQAERFRDFSAQEREFALKDYANQVKEFNRQLDLGVNFNIEAKITYLNDLLKTANRNLLGQDAKAFLKQQYETEASQISQLQGVNTEARLMKLRDEYQVKLKQVQSQAEINIDRQFGILDSFSPKNDAQRAIVEQRILRAASNVDPEELRPDQRLRIADVFEKVADRQAKQAQEAFIYAQKQTLYLEQVRGYTKILAENVDKEGAAAIQNIVTIRNETDNDVKVEQPNQDSVLKQYDYFNYRGFNV